MISRTSLSALLRRFSGREEGAVAITVALLLPMVLGIVALVEASRVYGVKNQLQTTADAAAMASVLAVPVLASVEATAADYVHRNMPADGQYGDVLDTVEMGRWDGSAFLPAAEPANAVRVTTDADMPLFFAAALRVFQDAPTSFMPSAKAVALVRLDNCYLNGFVAGGIIDMNSSNTFKPGFCAYGHGGVTMNSSNVFEPGSEVGMSDLLNLTAGGNNPGLNDALAQKDLAAPVSGEAEQLITDLLAGAGPRPDYLSAPVTVNTLPAYPVAGTLYHVLDPGIELKGTHQNIGIISDHPITVRSNSVLSNVLLATRAAVDIRANVTIGDADYCSTGGGSSLIISAGAVTDKDIPVGTNSNIALRGVQVVSEGRIEMNSNLTISGVSIQSTSDIRMNSSSVMEVCQNGTSPNVTGNGTLVAQLVD